MNSIIHEFPLPGIKNPETAITDSMGWLKQYQLTSDAHHAENIANAGANYMALSYPEIKHFQVRDITDFCSWGCLLDDIGEQYLLHNSFPQLVNFFSSLQYICEEPDYQNPTHLGFSNENPLIDAFLNLKSRLSTWAGVSEINHLMKSIGYFISGIQWENSFKAQHTYPELSTFCAMRMVSSGLETIFALGHCVNNVSLTVMENTNPIMQVLTKSISLVAILDNDIYSYEKEKASNAGYFNNIIQIYLISYPDLSEEQAISKAIDLRNQTFLLYQLLKQKYHYIYEPTALYFKGLEDVISGNLVFSSINKRYKVANDQKGHNFTIIRSAKQDIIPPKDISSISWWWSLLGTQYSLAE